jgi:triosephosphate isomerase
MYFTYNQTKDWINNYKSAVELLCAKKAIKLIVCPSYESIALARSLLGTSTFLGAQDCSPYSLGAHSGQVSAASLKELMCTYCIVGHSEQRMYAHETDATITQKIARLSEQVITPIVCIGETQYEYVQGLTLDVIQRQLESVKTVSDQNILIAYEPRWSISTGNVPPAEHLKSVHRCIQSTMKSTSTKNSILYGGSITSKTITSIDRLGLFQGFLIGKASTDIKELSAIMQQL